MKYTTGYYADIYFVAKTSPGSPGGATKKILVVMADSIFEALEFANVAMSKDPDVVLGTDQEIVRVERFAAYGITPAIATTA